MQIVSPNILTQNAEPWWFLTSFERGGPFKNASPEEYVDIKRCLI